jgi:hypothetical protein
MAGIFGGVLAAAICVAGSSIAADDTTFTASYNISIGGLTIGRVEAKARFGDKSYVTAINGSTWGISRFVSDARALLAGSGRISGSKVTPGSYNLDTAEGDFETQVRMAMRGGSVVSVDAWPGLVEASDRVPITSRDRNNVLDPVGAFVVALDGKGLPDGSKVCNRTVKVFDGWQRFDIRLSYKDTRQVTGAFDGDVIVCAARYVPVAGHRPSREQVQYMAGNDRLEVWMAPVEGTRLLVPYRILIGTQIGDLVISARTFDTSGASEQANAN